MTSDVHVSTGPSVNVPMTGVQPPAEVGVNCLSPMVTVGRTSFTLRKPVPVIVNI